MVGRAPRISGRGCFGSYGSSLDIVFTVAVSSRSTITQAMPIGQKIYSLEKFINCPWESSDK